MSLVARFLGGVLASGLPMRLAGLATPRAGPELHGLRYGPHARARLDLVLPKRVAPATPLVVFFHGGSWQAGSRRHYGFLARTLAHEGIAVALPDYRLWPEARWPDFLQDGAAALAWVRGEPARQAGVPQGPLFVMGHSAGGFIAAALALDPRWLAGAGSSRDMLAGGVLVSAPIAWQPDDEPVRSIFAAAPGGMIQAVPDAAMLEGAPPLLLVHGTADTVVGPFHSEDLAAAMARAGRPAGLVTIPGADHIAPMMSFAMPARRWGFGDKAAADAVLAFLRERR